MTAEQVFLQQKFREYYRQQSVSVPEIETREFGIGEFGKKIVKRHLSFYNDKELNAFLFSFAPFYISYSAALYKKPSVSPMSAKELFAADLLYEFDADDIKTPCKKKHDSWKCSECKAEGKGSIEACTSCGARVSIEQWFCPECLNETKKQVFRLLEFLEKDFGFTEGISINFSGSAGYHVHVRNSLVRELSHDARIELIDYLTANNLLPENHGFFFEEKKLHCPNPKTSVGWGRRIISEIMEMIEQEKAEELAAFGHVSVKKMPEFLKKKQALLQSINEKQVLPSFPSKNSEKFWLSIVEYIIKKNSSKIDRQTSMDLSKIIRVPNTLHGSTALIAKSIQLEQLQKFDPLKEAVAFPGKEKIKVFINKAPKFYLAGEWFGPFEKESAELPLAASVFLLARGAGLLDGVKA